MATKFSDKTWLDFPNGLGSDTPTGWAVEADLEHEFLELHPGLADLTPQIISVLVYAASSGLPVVLTWDARSRPGLVGERIERKTTTVIVQRLYPGEHSARIRVRYCEFSHSIYLSDVRSADLPKTKIEFLPLVQD